MPQSKKVILISLDALAGSELQIIRTLPHFNKILDNGAYCPNESSVYPSLTFPSHASIITGCRPDTHGIVNNYVFDPYAVLPKWNFHAGSLKCKALWDYAAENDKAVLSMSWPVSAGANIRYSMPEMTPAKPKIWNSTNFLLQLRVLAQYGTPGFAIKRLLRKSNLPKAWFLGMQPQLDESMMENFLDAIDTMDFDIALLHIYGMDDAKHKHGNASLDAHAFLAYYDDFLGKLIQYVDAQQKTGCDVALIITGDHAQKDVQFAVYGNMVLERIGLCSYEDSRLKSYRAYMDSCDGMAYIYLKDGESREALLPVIREAFEENPGVSRIMERMEFIPLGCDSTADLVLEAKDGYGFESGWCTDVIPPDDDGIAPNHYKGLHGYLPNGDDYQTMLLCYGPQIAVGELPPMSIIDIMPTICQWLDFNIQPVDGQVIPIFKRN